MNQTIRPAQGEIQEQLTNRLPLLWVSLAFIAGILFASLVSLPAFVFLILSGTILMAVFLLHRRVPLIPFSAITYFLITFCLITFSFGAVRYQLAQSSTTPDDLHFYNDREYDLLVTGWLVEPPDYRDTYTNLRIRAEAVDTGDGDYPVDGLVLVRVGKNQTYQYGDRLRFRGRLATPPEDEDFSYRDYLAREGMLSYMPITEATVLPGNGGDFFHRALYALKDRSLANIYRLFPDPEASLLAGILLGVDTGLTRELQEAFKNTGTAHIIAISGFNIAIIAGIFLSLFRRALGPRRGAMAAMAGIALYTLLVGADAAVVRAAIMGGLSLLARQVGRRNLGLNTLAFVALVMALVNPLVLWDVGFQLSFFATLGLILYAEPLTQLAARLLSTFNLQPSTQQNILQPLSDFFLLTLAAQITTIPIMAYHFQRISLVSLIANPFILPAQPAVMILGGLAVLLSLVIFPLGQLAAWAAWPFVVYTIRLVELFNRVPHGTIFLGDFSAWFAVLFYAALLGVTFNWSRLKDFYASATARVKNISLAGALAALFVLTLLTWRAADSAPDGNLHITFVDVGSADAVLIQTPSGGAVLVNGGPSTARLSDELGRRLSFLDRSLDWLVIASTDEDEVSALPRVLERYPPENVLWSGNVEASFSARQLDVWLVERGTPVRRAETGQRLELGDGAFIEVQAEGPRGSVLLIQWKDFRALLTIGVSADTLESLEYGNAIGPVDVLLLADAGYAPVNPPDWIENLNPQLTVLSVAAGDEFGMPSDETLEALGGYTLLRTDRSGWISVITNGSQMWVEAERQAPVESEALNIED
jgi:competence protein ComEC